MRNRAKCKLCGDIIESMHTEDLQVCKCGSISVLGGDGLRCHALDWNNFLRVDDEGNEIVVTVKDNTLSLEEENEKVKEWVKSKITKEDMLGMLEDMIKSYDNLPQHAMLSPVTHADFVSLMLLLSSILRA